MWEAAVVTDGHTPETKAAAAGAPAPTVLPPDKRLSPRSQGSNSLILPSASLPWPLN